MKVVIVAKTRMRSGACVGAITFEGRSVRLLAPNQEALDHFNLEYEVGDVWEIDAVAPPILKPPHVENVTVREKRRLRTVAPERVIGYIEKSMPPVTGGPPALFEGCLRRASSGALYVGAAAVPTHSTTFWRPDRDLLRDEEGKRIHYRYDGDDGPSKLTFVGFQEPLDLIPAGSLLRVSLAHWWRPEDRPDQELRCYAQLSGWYDSDVKMRRIIASAPRHGSSPRVSTHLSLPQAQAQMAAARVLLKSVFGYDEFLPLQEDVIANVLARRDTLTIMPTGAGKSMCYQLPALLFEGLTVVVSPLIALMQDQVDALLASGVPAAYLNSTVDYHSYVDTANRVRAGEVKLLYMAPETLLRPETLVMLDRSRVTCFTIDEAHCISSWGHDFRPEYRQLLPVRARYPNAVCLALTATATRRVQDDIKEVLGFGASNTFIASFDRPNLFLRVEPRVSRIEQITAFLDARPDQSGIIYCQKRKDAEALAAQLTLLGRPALPYHAGMADDARRANQRRFTRDEAQIICATIAFGMGINKSNVRFILHTALPENLENYYQQIGRAGRDGLPADCLLLWSMADISVIRSFIKDSPPEEQPGKEARLQAMLRYAQAAACRRVPLLGYFGEKFTGNCGACDTCVPQPAQERPTKEPGRQPRSRRRDAQPTAPAASAEDSRELFEELRKLRLELAREARVPPFVIFSDKTLQDMAQKRPLTEAALLNVSGVGERKLASYGAQFLAAINQYCEGSGSPVQPASAAPASGEAGARRAEIAAFFNKGVSVEDLQRLYGIKAATVLSHLVGYHAEGRPVDAARLLPYVTATEQQQADAFALFAELGVAALRPVFDALGGQISFDDLRLLRIYYLSQADEGKEKNP